MKPKQTARVMWAIVCVVAFGAIIVAMWSGRLSLTVSLPDMTSITKTQEQDIEMFLRIANDTPFHVMIDEETNV